MIQFKRILPILILLAAVLIILGCSKKILGPSDWNNGPVNVQLKISDAEMPMAIGSVTLTVTGPGIASPVVDTLVDSAGFLVGANRVPAGLARKFLVEVRAPGEVSYGPVIMSGMTTADVAPFIVTKLDINLKPVVPLIALLPGYQEITAGDYFTFDLSVFNLDTLSTAQFNISYYDTLKFTIDSVVRGSSLDSNIIVRSAIGGGSITIDIGTIGNIASPLPQTGHYATIYLKSTGSVFAIPDTSNFYPYLNYVNGNYLNYAVYNDAAQVIITKSPIGKPGADIFRGNK